ncbi:hypothetical protein OIU84_029832 [Salix udensis]|uniref:Uncharacterized protein n=1 Tax=Salix udensis TaxID=889485 RepID=A0AAD6P7R2_9ROSI|nr:hypothetical protein OIU84_029832 [Salix udensis]
MSEEELRERKDLVGMLKQEGNKKFWSGQIEKAVTTYTKALDLCPLKMRKERIVLYSNRGQSYLLLHNAEAVISDTTRALCLSSTASPHRKSLWRRAQAYDMKGLAKESLMDCLMFIHGRMKAEKTKHAKIPYFAARMIHKQMSATWLFSTVAKSKNKDEAGVEKPRGVEHGEDLCQVTEEIKERNAPDGSFTEGKRRSRSRKDRSRQERTLLVAMTAELAAQNAARSVELLCKSEK